MSKLNSVSYSDTGFCPSDCVVGSLLLCRYGLSRLSPLLSGVLAVEEGKVMVTVTPEELTLPAPAYSIRVEPLRYCFL